VGTELVLQGLVVQVQMVGQEQALPAAWHDVIAAAVAQ